MLKENPMHLNEKNVILDIFKLLLSFLIIIIHFSSNETSPLVLCSRIAVPSFFIIAGFFFDNWKLDQHARLLKAHKSLIKNIVYTAIPFIVTLVAIYIIQAITGRYIFLVNHFWFIRDLLIISALYIVLIRFRLEKILYFSAFPLLILNFIIGDYSGLIFGGEQFSIFLTMNALFTGIPFFALGLLLKRYVPKINWKIILILGLIGITFLVTIPFESKLLNMAKPTTLHFSLTITLSASCLSTAILFLPSFTVKPWYIKFISKDLSRDIYLWHLLIGYIFVLCGFQNYFVTFFVTAAFSFIYSLAVTKPLDFLTAKLYSLVTYKKNKNKSS